MVLVIKTSIEYIMNNEIRITLSDATNTIIRKHFRDVNDILSNNSYVFSDNHVWNISRLKD